MRSKIGLKAMTVLSVGLLMLSVACTDDGPVDDVSFDRSSLLTSIADGLIIPNFQTLQSSVTNLSTAVDLFVSDPSEENLEVARSAWEQAVLDYQHTSAFGFGPASLPLGPFATVLGVFPVDEAQVEENIGNTNFNLAASFDRDVRGFYSIEYLLYGNGQTDEELIAAFTQERLAYLTLITEEVKTTSDAIVSEWTGTYREAFVSSDGTSAGSSISLFYNEFVKDYENLKNFKVELPAGLTAGQNAADPSLVEAYYSGMSKELLTAHFQNASNIWEGVSRSGEELIGFEEYLEAVVGGPELITQTRAALQEINQAIDNLPEGILADHVETQEVRTLRDLLQANTANFKSSMSSLLGISITFNSGDGD